MPAITKKDNEVGTICIGFECGRCGLRYMDNSLPVSWVETDSGKVFCPDCLRDMEDSLEELESGWE